MTDTTTKVREHYSATELINRIKCARDDHRRRADVDRRSTRSTRPVPYARHPRHRRTGHRRCARATDPRASNQQLAARIGSVREVVSRTLNRFVAEGIIEIEKRSHNGMGYHLLLTNESALQRCAELT